MASDAQEVGTCRSGGRASFVLVPGTVLRNGSKGSRGQSCHSGAISAITPSAKKATMSSVNSEPGTGTPRRLAGAVN